jgi:hypothetical protein
MRKLIAGVLLAGAVLVQGVPAEARSAGSEVGWSMLSAAGNLIYTPTKVIIATLGLVAGAVVGLINGGDERSAYAIWVPTASGTYVLTPGHFDRTKPFEMWGTDYADTPSLNAHDTDATHIYDAKYAGN